MPNPENTPAGPRPWYHVGPVVALADPDEPDQPESNIADVYVYDVIGGWWGLTADDFVRDVAGLDVDTIVLHLNTPGGEVSQGTAIANMLRQHKAAVKVMVDGMAASSGSVIAMAGDEIVMGLGSQLMIHNPTTWTAGDEDEMDKALRMLRSTGDAIASTYAAKAGGTVEEWRAVMKAETWYSADEAVKAGLANRVATDDDKGSAAGQKVTPGRKRGFWDLWDSLSDPHRHDEALAAYHYRGRGAAPTPTLPGRNAEPTPADARAAIVTAAEAARRIHAATTKTTPTDRPGKETHPKEASVDAAKIREALGLAADASDAEVTTALAAAGLGQAGPPATPPETTEPADKPVAVGSLPPGMRLISDSAYQADQERMKRLEAHVAKQQRDERDSVIAQAVKDGRFTVAQKDHFTKLWDADPEGTRNLINSLQKNAALATAELGHGGAYAEDDENGEFAEFDALYPPHQRLAKSGKGA